MTRLVRNESPDSVGKYLVARAAGGEPMKMKKGEPDECFVLLLKDRHAQVALRAYAASVREEDPEYAADIDELAERAGPASPWCKTPD